MLLCVIEKWVSICFYNSVSEMTIFAIINTFCFSGRWGWWDRLHQVPSSKPHFRSLTRFINVTRWLFIRTHLTNQPPVRSEGISCVQMLHFACIYSQRIGTCFFQILNFHGAAKMTWTKPNWAFWKFKQVYRLSLVPQIIKCIFKQTRNEFDLVVSKEKEEDSKQNIHF